MYTVENLVPLPLVFRHGDSLVIRKLSCPHDCLLSVYPRGNECRQSAGHILALLAHGPESIDCALCLAADFPAYVPAAEAAVFLAVHLPYLVNDEPVVLYFPRQVSRIPVLARVIESEPELHAVLLGKPEEHVDEVHRRHIASLLEKVRRRIRDEFPVS